jgi:colicin import membrane protein
MSAAVALPAPYRLPNSADNWRALVFAVLIHVAAALLMFVGVWTSVEEPMIDAGEPIDAVMIDLAAAPLPRAAPKPVPPKPVPAPPKPTVKPEPEVRPVESGKPDDVTDQRLAPPKPDVDPLAIAQEEERKRNREEQKRIQLAQIQEERRIAEAERIKAQKEFDRVKAEQERKEQAKEDAARRERIAEEERALRGTVQTEDLLAQWRNAVRLAIEGQWSLPTGTPAKLQCGVRITAIKGGTVVFRTVTQPCQLPAELQQTLLDAVDAADPLPYLGFESVFQTEIPIIFVTPESN